MLTKNLLNVSATSLSFEIIFSNIISLLSLFNFFSIKVILDLDLILSVKRGFILFQNTLSSEMSAVFNLLKNSFFSRLIRLTQ